MKTTCVFSPYSTVQFIIPSNYVCSQCVNVSYHCFDQALRENSLLNDLRCREFSITACHLHSSLEEMAIVVLN